MAAEHASNGRIGAHVSWARTPDRSARTAPAREAFLARFESEVDPTGELPLEERRTRAEHAKRAYMQRLAKSSAKSRARRTNVVDLPAGPTASPAPDGAERGVLRSVS